MSVQEAAKALDIHPITVYKWVKAGRLRAQPGHPTKRRQGLRIVEEDVLRIVRGE